MSSLESQVEPNDPQRGRLSDFYYKKYLKPLAEEKGLATFQEQAQSGLMALGRAGAVTVTVTPTPLAIELADKQQKRSDRVLITTYTWELISIVQDTVYTSPRLPATDQYRLVLGTWRRRATAAALRLGLGDAKEAWKFRALLKFDPFDKTYKMVRYDNDYGTGIFSAEPGNPWP